MNWPDGVVGYHVSLTPIRSWDRAPVWSFLFAHDFPWAFAYFFFFFFFFFFWCGWFVVPWWRKSAYRHKYGISISNEATIKRQ